MKSEESQIRKAVEKLSEGKVFEESRDSMQKVFENILQKGMTPKAAMGVSDAQMDGYYALAYRLYNSGKFEQASSVFRLLVVLDSSDPKYALGLAACLHMLKAYADAAKIYTICSYLDPNNPIPQFHASDCYLQMRDSVSALLALELAVKRAGNKPEYQVLKDRALLTIDSIKKELKEMAQAGQITEEPEQKLPDSDPWAIT